MWGVGGFLGEDFGSLKGFDCEDLQSAIRAGGAALNYLRENQRGAIGHINRLTRKRTTEYMLLDATAQRNLDLLKNQQDGSKDGALIGVLDRTLTPMGARLMRQWIVAPLKDPAAICQRLDVVAELVAQRTARDALQDLLRQVGDLERMMARICCQRANARDLVGLAHSLGLVPQIRHQLQDLQSTLLQHLGSAELIGFKGLIKPLHSGLEHRLPSESYYLNQCVFHLFQRIGKGSD